MFIKNKLEQKKREESLFNDMIIYNTINAYNPNKKFGLK